MHIFNNIDVHGKAGKATKSDFDKFLLDVVTNTDNSRIAGYVLCDKGDVIIKLPK